MSYTIEPKDRQVAFFNKMLLEKGIDPKRIGLNLDNVVQDGRTRAQNMIWIFRILEDL